MIHHRAYGVVDLQHLLSTYPGLPDSDKIVTLSCALRHRLMLPELSALSDDATESSSLAPTVAFVLSRITGINHMGSGRRSLTSDSQLFQDFRQWIGFLADSPARLSADAWEQYCNTFPLPGSLQLLLVSHRIPEPLPSTAELGQIYLVLLEHSNRDVVLSALRSMITYVEAATLLVPQVLSCLETSHDRTTKMTAAALLTLFEIDDSTKKAMISSIFGYDISLPELTERFAQG